MLSAPHSTAPLPAPRRSQGLASAVTGCCSTCAQVQAARHSAHMSPTFVVACDPPHAVSKGDFSPNKVSENSDLIHKDRRT